MSDPVPAPTPVVPGRVGLLGGTFDPVHIGHLAAAEEARERLGLERVLFVPAGDPWQKSDRAVSDGRHRRAMLELALAGAPGFGVSTIELDRAGPTYSADTVEALAAAERAVGGDPDLWFILSVEAARGLPTWHQPWRLLAACRLAVVPRPGSELLTAAWFDGIVAGAAERVVVLDRPRIGVSGTEIRARVRAGRSIRYLVPEAVRKYIEAEGLYRPRPEEADRP